MVAEGPDDQATIGRLLKRSLTARHKALVATIVSVLKPGRANAPSIADDEWICELTEKNVPEVALLKQFLVNLLELSVSEPSITSLTA